MEFPTQWLRVMPVAALLLAGCTCIAATVSPDPVAPAEALWLKAQARTLSAPDCDAAARLLDHPDPFAAALAEWALAIKVGLDNGGQQIKWPREDPPPWFAAWIAIPAETRLRMDYCRQGIGWDLHKDVNSLARSAHKILARARSSAKRTRSARPAAAAELTIALDHLDALRETLQKAGDAGPQALPTARALWLDMRRAARAIVLASPEADFAELAFIQRHSAHSHRNITGSQYPWVHKPGGSIMVKTGLAPEAPLRDVLAGQLGPGHVHGMDLWWDGDRIVFAYAQQPDWPPAHDTVRGSHAPTALTSITPFVNPQEGPMTKGRVAQGGVPNRGGLYQTPWALSDTCFLAAYSYARPPSNSSGGRNTTNFGIYFIDVFGNKELIHRDPIYSTAFPMPVSKRQRPPVVPDLAPRLGEATICVVADVYSDLPGIRRGAARYLRISQRLGWPLDGETGAKRWIPGNAWEPRFGYWAWAPVRVLGTVPVESDGSAHFRVPPGTAVYFQILDENHMELRRMRSHIALQEGETRGCNGCHESQLRTPPRTARVPTALLRPADTPTPPSWGADRLLGYEWLIQPIFERNCVRCHGRQTPAAGLDLSKTHAEDGFMQSFRSLFGRRPGDPPPVSKRSTEPTSPVLVSVANRLSGASVSAPKAFGSHRSRLVSVLREDKKHRSRISLTDDGWQRLFTWIDANAPYYDTFYQKRPVGGGPPVRNVTLRLPVTP